MTFWQRVEQLRGEQNTSYRWLAAVMGIPETTLSTLRHENREPRASDAVKIAKALGTTVEYLSTGEKDAYYRKYTDLVDSLSALISGR